MDWDLKGVGDADKGRMAFKRLRIQTDKKDSIRSINSDESSNGS